VPQHNSIVSAKQIATFDVLSDRRCLFGVGAGWNSEKLRNYVVDPAHCWRVMREHVLAMKRIWTENEAKFHGQFVDFDSIWH
jgi:alkanesulfonate monooxygenase SsuD/methylene tetrahydromethanopterin reductase-like flavin-dependent oxidoreductase (luciferase family)